MQIYNNIVFNISDKCVLFMPMIKAYTCQDIPVFHDRYFCQILSDLTIYINFQEYCTLNFTIEGYILYKE